MEKQYQTYLEAIKKAKEKFPEIKVSTYEEYLSKQLADAKKAVKNAVIAGCIVAVATVILSIFKIAGMTYYNFLDVFLVLGLIYGMYKYNKLSGVLMVIYFIANSVFRLIASKGSFTIMTIAVIILFLALYVLGAIGIFTYHTIIREMKDDKDKTKPDGKKKTSMTTTVFIILWVVAVLLVRWYFVTSQYDSREYPTYQREGFVKSCSKSFAGVNTPENINTYCGCTFDYIHSRYTYAEFTKMNNANWATDDGAKILTEAIKNCTK